MRKLLRCGCEGDLGAFAHVKMELSELMGAKYFILVVDVYGA